MGTDPQNLNDKGKPKKGTCKILAEWSVGTVTKLYYLVLAVALGWCAFWRRENFAKAMLTFESVHYKCEG